MAWIPVASLLEIAKISDAVEDPEESADRIVEEGAAVVVTVVWTTLLDKLVDESTQRDVGLLVSVVLLTHRLRPQENGMCR